MSTAPVATAWKYLRYLVAAIILVGVGGSLQQALASGEFVPWNFFGYFTIQTNLIGATALIVAAPFSGRERPAWVEYLRVGAAVYLTVVVAVYWTLLYSPESINWTDYIVHLLSGIVLVADWVLEGPRTRLPLRTVWVVITYPAVWIVVVLIRGATDGWFPYPFLNPANGYGSIAVVVAGIVVAGLVLGTVLFGATRWRVVTPASSPA